LVVQEEHDEAHHRDLRDDVDAAAPAGEPETPVPQRDLDIRRLDVLLGSRAEHERADNRARQDTGGDEEETRLRAPELRQHDRRDHAADRDGGLADAEREPALARREPAHDRAAAAGLDAAAGDPGQSEEGDEPAEGGRERSRGKESGAAGQPDGERPALAEAVGGETPRQHGQRQPDPLRREHDADLRQAEVVLVAQRRREHRDRERDRGEGRLGRGARREDGPAVVQSWNGLIGREPVLTVTLFVSR
jgi:hypothetical protein